MRFDENVQFAAIIDAECNMVESSESIQAYGAVARKIFSDKLHYLLAKEYARRFRCYSFLSIHRETYLELVFPMQEKILCVICNPETRDVALSDKILAMVSTSENFQTKDPFYANCCTV